MKNRRLNQRAREKKREKFYLLTVAFGLAISSTSYAQVSFSGTVKTSTGKPIELATVSLQKDSTLFLSTVTDSLGWFMLPAVEKGTYTLLLSYLGAKQVTIQSIEEHTVAHFQLDEPKELEAVLVVKKKPLIERKVDRLIFNVENSIAATGGDALDALKVTPNISVRSGQVEMIGKSGMGVMVDDQLIQLSGEDLVNFLKTIRKDDIQRIEVISNPPAKYSAEGNSGLVNIVLKKGRRNSWSDAVRTSYTQTSYSGLSLGNTFTYNRKKVNLLVNLDAENATNGVIEKAVIDYPEETWRNRMDRKDQQKYLSGRVVLDYAVSDKTALGIQYSGTEARPLIRDNNSMNVYDSNNSLTAYILTNGVNTRTRNNHTLNLNYRRTLDTLGRKVSVDLDYIEFNATQNRDFSSARYVIGGTPSDKLSAVNSSAQHNKNYSARVDFEHPMKWAEMSYGARVGFTTIESVVRYTDKTSGVPVLDSLKSDNFSYTENIQAVYWDASKVFNTRWTAKLGLRVENTQTEGFSKSYNQTNRYSYIQLFPSFYLLRTLSGGSSLNLAYNRRINRASFSDLNPFRWYLNAISYVEGNPFLRPAFINNIELSHNYKDKLFSSLFFSKTDNGFSQVPTVNPVTKQQIYTRQNYYNQYTVGISETYSFNPLASWASSNALYVYYSHASIFNTALNAAPQNSLWTYLSSTNSFVFNKKKTFLAELSFWCALPGKSILYQVKECYSLDASIKLFVFKKKMQCSLSVTDIFRSSTPTYTAYTNQTRQAYYVNPDSRYLIASLRYSFGNNNVSPNDRGDQNDDIKNRLRN